MFPQLISRYYEHYFWKYFESDPRRRVEYQSKLSRMKTDSSQILLLGLKQLDGLREDIKAFLPKRIAVTQTNPDPNKFINELTSRINKIQGLNQIAGSIFQTGHGQISVMVYDELIKLTQSFDSEVNSYTIPIPDEIFQKQFKAEMFKISQNLKNEEKEKNKNESEKIAKKRIKLGLILNELGEKNNLKVDEQELRNEIQKQVQSMPSQQKQILEYYQKNPSATTSLRGSIYEEKIINLIKQKSKQTKKTISIKEAEEIIKAHSMVEKPSELSSKKEESKKAKKTIKSSKNKKKIRKK